jgi:hypothetical protein
MTARTKLTYCDDERSNGASASRQLLEDIKASYSNLNSDPSYNASCGNSSLIHNPLIFRLKGIKAQPVWNVDDFPGLLSLVDHADEIRKELAHLMQTLEQGDAASLWKVNDTPAGKWSICHLVDQGVQTKAVAECPVTWRAVSHLPCAMKDNLFGNVAFSIVEPGTKISAHCGPTNIRIRCHLGMCWCHNNDNNHNHNNNDDNSNNNNNNNNSNNNNNNN